MKNDPKKMERVSHGAHANKRVFFFQNGFSLANSGDHPFPRHRHVTLAIEVVSQKSERRLRLKVT